MAAFNTSLTAARNILRKREDECVCDVPNRLISDGMQNTRLHTVAVNIWLHNCRLLFPPVKRSHERVCMKLLSQLPICLENSFKQRGVTVATQRVCCINNTQLAAL